MWKFHFFCNQEILERCTSCQESYRLENIYLGDWIVGISPSSNISSGIHLSCGIYISCVWNKWSLIIIMAGISSELTFVNLRSMVVAFFKRTKISMKFFYNGNLLAHYIFIPFFFWLLVLIYQWVYEHYYLYILIVFTKLLWVIVSVLISHFF